MLSITKTLALFGLVSNLALANTFAEFCNDDNCSEGCGLAVDTNNPGCLTQYGRRSVRFHGINSQDVSLIASPGDTCDCQNYCEDNIVSSVLHVFGENDGCFKLRDEEVRCFGIEGLGDGLVLTLNCRLNRSASSLAAAQLISVK
ncbi:uncharacterized protein LTR77_006373 [Saxophila tyrrhenica]|uniref:Uncharacterized protein n=1 Tax=Saxophila tyrrhenica TaxID=1690608 RepID=A0AAV9P7Q4_9PEZI|nr:hypothetical protein LTR77_006373 [Saxophila tyrrhenica]